jgi:hypothetical protein
MTKTVLLSCEPPAKMAMAIYGARRMWGCQSCDPSLLFRMLRALNLRPVPENVKALALP